MALALVAVVTTAAAVVAVVVAVAVAAAVETPAAEHTKSCPVLLVGRNLPSARGAIPQFFVV